MEEELDKNIVCHRFRLLYTVNTLPMRPLKKEDYFYQQIGLKFNEETSELLHFEHSIVWC